MCRACWRRSVSTRLRCASCFRASYAIRIGMWQAGRTTVEHGVGVVELAQHGGTPWTTVSYRFVDAPEGLPTARALDVAAPIQAGFVWVTKGAFGFMGALNIFGLLGLVATGAAMFMLLSTSDAIRWRACLGAQSLP